MKFCNVMIICFFIILVIIVCIANSEKFITLSALNFAAAGRARQLRYYDYLYGRQGPYRPKFSTFGYSYNPQFQPTGLYGWVNPHQGGYYKGRRIY